MELLRRSTEPWDEPQEESRDEPWDAPPDRPPAEPGAEAEPAAPRAPTPAPPPDWWALPEVLPDRSIAEEARIVCWHRSDPAHRAFDLLRTRLAAVLAQRGWRRVGIASARRGAGRTTVAANLALSLGRRRGRRTVLLDLDLGEPGLAHCLGLGGADWPMARFLAGALPAEDFLARIGAGLAVGLNTERAHDPAALLHDPGTARRLDAMTAAFRPDAVLCDLPPLLGTDDALGFLGALDAVLLVAPAGGVEAGELEACERLLEGGPAFLGVVLNRAPAEDCAGLPEALEEPG